MQNEPIKVKLRIPTNRIPTHPGEMLLDEFLIPMGITQRDLANAIHGSYRRVNDLVNGRQGVTLRYSFRLAKFFGNSPEFWMGLQLRWDLYHAEKSETKIIETIQTYQHHAGTP